MKMIVRREDGQLWLFMQTDHALLAGTIAAHWGNETFRPPVSRERTAQAITHHDDGWITWEAEPKVNRQTDRPYTFTEMLPEDALDIWYRGPKQTGERDPYAGILVSMHGSYLLGSRFKNAADTPADKEQLGQYLQDMDTLRERLQGRLRRTSPDAEDLLNGVYHAYRLLQICDDLSLRFCTRPLEAGTLPEVPRAGMDDLTPLEARPLDERILTLDPWPLDMPELWLPIRVRQIPDRRYTTYNDLNAEMLQAHPTLIPFRLLRGSSSS